VNPAGGNDPEPAVGLERPFPDQANEPGKYRVRHFRSIGEESFFGQVINEDAAIFLGHEVLRPNRELITVAPNSLNVRCAFFSAAPG